jgi:hypothetical protein
MPESLTRRESAYVNLWGVRLHVGMASGFSSERCPASPRNRVRLQVGIASGIASEYLAGISRNLQAGCEVMDPDEIIERMRRRFHEDAIRHFARALPPPQPTNE